MPFAPTGRLSRHSLALAVVLCGMFAFAAAPARADQTFSTPMANGAAVDNCAVWGTNCGWGGAHQFCQTQGFAAARSWALYNPGRTWVIGSQKYCDGPNCVGFSQVVCMSNNPPPVTGGGVTFNNPMVNGAVVDNCAVWGTNCGWGGAHQFCQTQGYAAAASWALNNPGRTWVIGSQKFCEGPNCVGFSQVVCIKSGGAVTPPPPPPPTTTNEMISGRWAWPGYTNWYYIQQNGNTFTWSWPPGNETATGTIEADGTLHATWTNPSGTGHGIGTITARDAQGRATDIHWDNGVNFHRYDQ